ncbi:glycosyltransferase, partial [Halalkalibacter sp. AB-rgal2]|uniref:glycosyltransferase n=1 Tax=Halalkalibacter sp. AB-rgal2 TaxID=3242695 RepID=UPI00359E993C
MSHSSQNESKDQKGQDQITTERVNELERTIQLLETERDQYKQERIKMEKELMLVKQSFVYKQVSRAYRWLQLAYKVAIRKRSIQELLNPKYQIKKAKPKIKKVRYRLNELGFTKKALAELEQLCNKSDNPYVRRLAAWELALWFASQYNVDEAKKSLLFLEQAAEGEKNKTNLRRITIIEAECYLQLGMEENAEQVIDEQLQKGDHDDLYLAKANIKKDFHERLRLINQVFENHDMMTLDLQRTGYTYDDLVVNNYTTIQPYEQVGKVTIIIPVYNAENCLRTTISSILNQTWRHIEVLIVDDHSQDDTIKIIEEFQQKDKRIQLLKNDTNSGPYVARNRALQVATGDFVTINDADDWSHPEKIEHQVKHLVSNPSVIANTTEQARATDTLMFYRRGRPGEYLFANMSSLMFRREPVLKQIGYWDSVRFGADGEFKKRLKRVFGKDAVVDLKTGPYSFQRQSSHSLTGNSTFGYHGYFMGARKEYVDQYETYHKSGKTLYYQFPQEERPFPVPEPMWPKREDKPNGRRHFDVIIASEFRLLGGTNMSNVEEIKAQRRLGLRTGLVQLSRYDLNSATEMNPQVRELLDGDQVSMLVYGEKVSCDVLIVRHPPILEEWQKYVPD